MLLQNELCPQENKYYMTTFDSILSVPMAPAQIPMYSPNKKKTMFIRNELASSKWHCGKSNFERTYNEI